MHLKVFRVGGGTSLAMTDSVALRDSFRVHGSKLHETLPKQADDFKVYNLIGQ